MNHDLDFINNICLKWDEATKQKNSSEKKASPLGNQLVFES